MEIVQIIPQERMQNRTAEQIVDVPIRQIWDEIVEVIRLNPQERMLERIVD